MPCNTFNKIKEEQIALPTLQDKTAIVGTREEDKVVYPTLDALFQRSWTKNIRTLICHVTRLIKFSMYIHNSNVSHRFQDHHDSI